MADNELFNNMLSVVLTKVLKGSQDNPAQELAAQAAATPVSFEGSDTSDFYSGFGDIKRRRDLVTKIIGGKKYSMTAAEWASIDAQVRGSVQNWVEEQEMLMDPVKYAKLLSIYNNWKNGSIL